MHDDSASDGGDGLGGPQPVGSAGQFTQRVRHQQVSARVPESVARGVFASGALVLNGAHEFIIDFLQSLTRPQLVVTRVVLPPTIVASMLRALRQNIDNYAARFGAIPELPKPPQPARPPSVEEIYEQLKLTDYVGAGVYANTVMITHSPSEFCFDFIASFYPRSVVASRVYMAAPQVPRVLETLGRSFEQFQAKLRQQQQQQGGPAQPPPATRPPEDAPDQG